MRVIEIQSGDLVEELQQRCAELGVKNAAVVSLIGAVDSFTVSTMPVDDATRDVITDYGQPAEMTGTGEIVDGRVHLHAVMAIVGDQGVAGHLHRAQVGTWFARVYLVEV